MKTIWLRLKAETPIFWKKARKLALQLGASAVAVWLINSQMNLEISVLLVQICKYTIVACAAIAGTASLTKSDNV